MYQKPYTCTELNVLLHFSDLKALINFYGITIYEGPHFQTSKSILTSKSGVKVDILYYHHWVTHSVCMNLIGIWVCEVHDCRWLLKTFISKIFGFAVLKSLYCIILCQCHHPPFHILTFMYIAFSTCQFKQVWCWDVDQTLYFTLEKHKKCWSFRGSAPDSTGGAHSAPPDSLAGFKPILCLVVFFVGPKCMQISLSPHF